MAGAAPPSAPMGDADVHGDAFRKLYPLEFYQRFVESGLRPDGRPLGRCRPATVGLQAVGAGADGSALVKLGSTTVLAGVRLEIIAQERDDKEAKGSLSVSVEVTPLATPDWRPGRPPEAASWLEARLSDTLAGGHSPVLDVGKLQVEGIQAVWAVYIDVYVLDADGALSDAALLACVAALCDTTIPAVYTSKGGAVERCGPLGPDGSSGGAAAARKLPLECVPISLTCGWYQEQLVWDPTREEEELLPSLVSVTVDEQGRLLGVYKPGGTNLAPSQALMGCIQAAKARHAEVLALLQQSLQAAAEAPG